MFNKPPTIEELFVRPDKGRRNRMRGFFKAAPTYAPAYNDEDERNKCLLLSQFVGQEGETVDLEITITAVFMNRADDSLIATSSKKALVQMHKTCMYQANVVGGYSQVRFSAPTGMYRAGQEYRIRGVVEKHVASRNDQQVIKQLNQIRPRQEKVTTLRQFIPYTHLKRVGNLTDCGNLLKLLDQMKEP